MNHFVYKLTIFDTAPNANLNVFPKIETHSAFADSAMDAQRQIVEDLYDLTAGGTCARYSTRQDSADRFHIVFGDPTVRPVTWDQELRAWAYADENVPEDARKKQLEWAKIH